jgi:hypothetical protein
MRERICDCPKSGRATKKLTNKRNIIEFSSNTENPVAKRKPRKSGVVISVRYFRANKTEKPPKAAEPINPVETRSSR